MGLMAGGRQYYQSFHAFKAFMTHKLTKKARLMQTKRHFLHADALLPPVSRLGRGPSSPSGRRGLS